MCKHLKRKTVQHQRHMACTCRRPCHLNTDALTRLSDQLAQNESINIMNRQQKTSPFLQTFQAEGQAHKHRSTSTLSTNANQHNNAQAQKHIAHTNQLTCTDAHNRSMSTQARGNASIQEDKTAGAHTQTFVRTCTRAHVHSCAQSLTNKKARRRKTLHTQSPYTRTQACREASVILLYTCSTFA